MDAVGKEFTLRSPPANRVWTTDNQLTEQSISPDGVNFGLAAGAQSFVIVAARPVFWRHHAFRPKTRQLLPLLGSP